MASHPGNKFALKHGHSWNEGGRFGCSPTYNSWKNMNKRCAYSYRADYEAYGARGIVVCERWRFGTPGAFLNFLADMGERPKGKSIDRRDVNGNYEPDNCRWADRTTQDANKRPRQPEPYEDNPNFEIRD